jgi:hypothetical protein
MTELTDTQLVVLSAACERPDRSVLPLPANLKGGAAQKVAAGLLAKGLVEEGTAGPADPVWRTDEDGIKIMLLATDAAFKVLGIEADGDSSHSEEAAPVTTKRDGKAKPQRKPTRAAKEPKAAALRYARKDTAGAAQARGGTKQAQLIAMLKQPNGASLDEIVAATGWQGHTVRGSIAGALKKKARPDRHLGEGRRSRPGLPDLSGPTTASLSPRGRRRVFRPRSISYVRRPGASRSAPMNSSTCWARMAGCE